MVKECKGLGRWFAALIITGLLAALALPLLSPPAVEAAVPSTPTNISPASGTTGISLTHTFRASAFSDTPGDTHYASQWQIRTSSGSYSSPVFDSGVHTDPDPTKLTQITIPAAPPVILRVNTTYSWHVRYQDDKGWWSSWSIETFFTTIVSANPSTPINMSPVNGATNVALHPTLQSSAFVSPDGGATHAASRWQITTTSGNYTSPVYDSGVDTDTAHRTQITLLSVILKVNTNYYWRIRHQDSYGNWSDWSIETSFKTIVSGNPGTPINISPVDGATDAALHPTLQSSAFVSPDGGATHAASRWQITTTSGNYTSPVYDSGVDTDTAHRTQITLLSVILKVNTNYYWRIRHQDSYGNWSDWSIETSFTTIADTTPPVISGVTVSSVTDTTATITWTTDEASTSQVEYGTTTVYGSATVLDATLVNSHSVTMSSLSANTIYHYRVRSKDAANNEAISADGTFTTAATPDTTPPVITVAPASTPTSTGTVITWTTNEVSTNQVEYGTTAAYGSTTTLDASLVIGHSVTLTGLIPSTTYHYRVKSKDASGNEVVSVDYTFTTSASAAPTTPTNVSPVGGATDVSLTPTLRSSAFSDPDAGDTHAASQWQITTTPGSYTPPAKIFDSDVDTANLTQVAIPSGILSVNATYYWHVRHQDSYGNWSGWSAETSFTTTAMQVPVTPSNVSPANGATGISLTPTLTSSVFSDADVGDSHKASRWQITTTLGNYTSPVFDGGVDTTDLTQIAIPPGYLRVNTTYYWHVKHQDSYGNWSGWSTETSFTTTAMRAPVTPSNISPADGATGISLTPMLTSSAFSDPDVGDSHTASRWQIATDNLFNNIVFNVMVIGSDIDASDLTQLTVPSGYLEYDITYYWHVRYYDSYGNYSGWSTVTSFTTAQVPVTPSNISPADGVTGISVTPMLTSSAFSDLDVGDSHKASQWQVREATAPIDYSVTVYDSQTDTINKTSILIPSGTLSYNTTYYWRVRHQDSYGYWSDWSTETSFTTVVLGIPSRPSNVSPANGATGVILTPTLRASVFDDDADPGDTHAASQWQIRKATDPPDYSVTVYDSGTDTTNLSQITIPSDILDYDSIYYWHVSYQDSSDDWSAYSTETSFTTVILSKWTFMVYLDADNNLGENSIFDFNQMELAGSTDDVNVVVLMDRLIGDWTTARLFRVTQDSDVNIINSTAIADWGEVNMGNPKTLEDFATWTMENQPAQHYVLVLWNHGDVRGVCWDDTSGGDYLTEAEIQQSLQAIKAETGVTLDIVGFDACLMGMAEIDYQIREYANIGIGSQELTYGWPYYYILRDLTADPDMTPSGLARQIVLDYGEYWDSFAPLLPGTSYTQSAIQLSSSATLADCVSDFAQSLMDSKEWDDIIAARADAEEFYHPDYGYGYVDLYHFASLVHSRVSDTTVQTEAQNVMDAINYMVLAETHDMMVHSNAHGISIFFPESLPANWADYRGDLDFSADTQWDEFLLACWAAVSLPPSTPSNVSPANGTTDISLTPILRSSAFSDPDQGDTHTASQWQITTVYGDYTVPAKIYDSEVDTSNLAQIDVPAGLLKANTTYYWHVRYQDSYGNWSDWSIETSFTTLLAQPPAPPTNSSPADGATSVSLTPTLSSSAFSDPDAGDSHAASQWQVREATAPIDYSVTVYDSQTDTINKTSILIPSGKLSYNTTYYWHVKYQDSYGKWSDWSTETSFTTAASGAPSTPNNLSPANDTTGIVLTPALRASDFSDNDPDDSHFASQWQIRTESETYDSPMFDSGVDTSNLTQIAISSGYLEYDTTYYWRVRYQDGYGNWSAWSTVTFFTTAIPRSPNQPTASSPSHGAAGISLTPTLRSSGFSARDEGDSHTASQWQIRTESGTYDSPVFDSGIDTVNLTRITIPAGKLDYGVTYYWRVRHQDRYKSWSAYSSENCFTTVTPPEQPTANSPSNEAVRVSLTPILQSSAFVSPDGEATQVASQWQITTTPGDYTSPVYDSGLDTTNKTSITVPSGILSDNTTYYWRVRYQDSYGTWSDYSSEFSFTTASLVVADFTAEPIKATPGQTVTFNDTSIGDATSWLWDFGDGTTIDWTTRPEDGKVTHSYSATGNYTVSLKVAGSAGEDTKTKVVLIQVPAPAPSHGKGLPWVPIVIGIVVVLAGGGLLWYMRRR